MSLLQEMLDAHPEKAQMDREALSECVTQLSSCKDTCILCADACLASKRVDQLTRCIRLDLDCADVCETTGRLLLRQLEPDWNLNRKQLEACVAACRICGGECQRHADMHEHCRICSESCRETEKACERLLQEVAAAR